MYNYSTVFYQANLENWQGENGAGGIIFFSPLLLYNTTCLPAYVLTFYYVLGLVLQPEEKKEI